MTAAEGGLDRAVRALIVGQCDGLDAVRAGLAPREDISLATAASLVPDGAAARHADVVLIATTGASLPWEEIEAVRDLGVPVIALGGPHAAGVLEQATDADLADALLLPQPIAGVAFAIRRAASGRRRSRPRSLRGGRVITVYAPKGGTGKTVIATNVASALASEFRRRVLVVDGDLQFGDCALALGLDPQTTIHDLMSSPGELDADKLGGYTVRDPRSGLLLLAAPARPDEAELVPVDRIPALVELAREAYDFTVVDTSPVIDAATLAVFDGTDELLLVATLDVPALKALRQGLEALELLQFPRERVSLVLNRADARVGITRREVESMLGAPFRFTLPSDRTVPLRVNAGEQPVLAEPGSPFGRAIREMAAGLLDTSTLSARDGQLVRGEA